MVTAFVLINVENKKVMEIADRLLAFPGVSEVHAVAGEYDIVTVIRVKTNNELSHLITEKIIHCQGVERTKTLFSLQSFSNLDLAGLFNLK